MHNQYSRLVDDVYPKDQFVPNRQANKARNREALFLFTFVSFVIFLASIAFFMLSPTGHYYLSIAAISGLLMVFFTVILLDTPITNS